MKNIIMLITGCVAAKSSPQSAPRLHCATWHIANKQLKHVWSNSRVLVATYPSLLLQTGNYSVAWSHGGRYDCCDKSEACNLVCSCCVVGAMQSLYCLPTL